MAKIPIILEPGRADGKLIKSNSIYDDNQEKFLSDKLEEIDNNHNTLNNVVNSLADEEDITRNTDGKLQFKNKESGDGMGYVILRKNKSFAEQVTKENTIYEIRYEFYLNNEKVTIPNNCILKFEGGLLKNGIVVCKNTIIKANNILIFENIILEGTLINADLIVEWWGVSPNTNALKNRNILHDYICPIAKSLKKNIYLSREGTYELQGSFPLGGEHIPGHETYGADDFTHSYCNGIILYGTGKNTIIKGISPNLTIKNPADVLNLPNIYDLTIKDLSITAEHSPNTNTSGTNGISLVFACENIIVENIHFFSLPYNNLKGYPDGGKAFTIQGIKLVKNIICRNCYMENVSFGCDCTKQKVNDDDYLDNVQFIGNVIRDSVAGCTLLGEVSEEYNYIRGIQVTNNTFINCQYGVYGEYALDAIISNNTIINFKEYENPDLYYSNLIEGIYMISARRILITNNIIKSYYFDYGIRFIPVSINTQFQPISYIKNIIIKNNLFSGNINCGICIGHEPNYSLSPSLPYYAEDNIIVDNKFFLNEENDHYISWMFDLEYLNKQRIVDKNDLFITKYNHSVINDILINKKLDFGNILSKSNFGGGYINDNSFGWTDENSYINLTYKNLPLGCYYFRIYVKSLIGEFQIYLNNNGTLKTIKTISGPITNQYIDTNIVFLNKTDVIKLYRITGSAEFSLEINLICPDIISNGLSVYGGNINFHNLPLVNLSQNTQDKENLVCVDNSGNLKIISSSNKKVIGQTSERPTNVEQGFQYFDIQLNKPIWWTGTKWVDSTSTDV